MLLSSENVGHFFLVLKDNSTLLFEGVIFYSLPSTTHIFSVIECMTVISLSPLA